mmetsp:Transcript_3800/g.10435  ORF Transcript_3800/g.10435 Transcript_3800/m.10435 type:complete len:119 (+) Transcript_3800:130-486(+)
MRRLTLHIAKEEKKKKNRILWIWTSEGCPNKNVPALSGPWSRRKHKKDLVKNKGCFFGPESRQCSAWDMHPRILQGTATCRRQEPAESTFVRHDECSILNDQLLSIGGCYLELSLLLC